MTRPAVKRPELGQPLFNHGVDRGLIVSVHVGDLDYVMVTFRATDWTPWYVVSQSRGLGDIWWTSPFTSLSDATREYNRRKGLGG